MPLLTNTISRLSRSSGYLASPYFVPEKHGLGLKFKSKILMCYRNETGRNPFPCCGFVVSDDKAHTTEELLSNTKLFFLMLLNRDIARGDEYQLSAVA